MTVTVYLDSNIYRYVAYEELAITTDGSIRFAYSQAHFDEMIRTGNTDMLQGMKALQAVGVVSNEDKKYDIDDIGVWLKYTDPFEKYTEYKEGVEPYIESENPIKEFLLAILGSDNHEELIQVPNSIVDLALDTTSYDSNDLVEKATEAAEGLDKIIKKEFTKPRPLTETRIAFGLRDGASSKFGGTENPIENIWSHIEEKANGLSRDQFFGFDKIPDIETEITRLNSISACHLVLNMLGLHPDKGLPNRDKIDNILSDGEHAGFASLCGGFITADIRLYKKAKAIYQYRNITTQVSHIKYNHDGMSMYIGSP